MTFTLFDIIILTIVLIFTLLGLYRGFINGSINLIGFIISILTTIMLYPYVKSVCIDQLKNDIFASILSGCVTYIFLYIVSNMISSKLLSLMQPFCCGPIDRFFGMILGGLKGCIIATILFSSMIIFLNNSQNIYKIDGLSKINSKEYPYWIKDSKTLGHLEYSLKQILKYLPNKILQIKVKSQTSSYKIEKKELINQSDKILDKMIENEGNIKGENY